MLLFVLPALIVFFYTVIIPFVNGFVYSFTDWDGIKSNLEFVGFANYIKILTTDKEFLRAFLFTSGFTLCSVVLVNVFGFSLALLVTKIRRGSNFLRSIFFMPNLVGGIILGFVWQFIFTKAFHAIGIQYNILWLQNWLSTTWTGFVGLLIVNSWQSAGYMMVIYISALEGIDPSILDSSAIDGASGWRQLRKIIIPMVASAFTVGIFFSLSGSFRLFDQNLTLTGGGPYNTTQMLALNIYKTAFSYNDMGLAQAKAIIFFLIIACISIIQMSISKKREVES